MFNDAELQYLISTAKKNRENSAFLAEVPEQRWKEQHKAEVVMMDRLIAKLEKMLIEKT